MHTQLLRQSAVDDDLALAVWSNRDDVVHYAPSGAHTLSLYLHGGFGTYRRDKPHRQGAPGRVCVMPAGRESDWVVQGEHSFLHLYFTPTYYARLAERTLDLEPTILEPIDRLLILEPWIERVGRELVLPLNWNETADRLALSQATNLLLVHLLRRHSQRRDLRFRGGLAPIALRRVEAYIEAYLDRPLSVAELAAQTALSEFHFARMFRLSTGLSPHEYVRERRLQHAKTRIAESDQPLGDIALACGFSSQSHFGQSFRQRFGVTPGDYRRSR